jgi:hypothetical protein
MAAVFTPAQKWKGSFRSDLLKLTFDDVGPGMLVQNMSFDYRQQVQMIYEVGEPNVYYVGGHAQGSAQIARIVGPGVALGAFFAKYGDICTPGNCVFSATGGCGGVSGAVSYKLEHCVLTQVGAGVSADSIVITEQIGLMFANLDITAAGAGGANAPASNVLRAA